MSTLFEDTESRFSKLKKLKISNLSFHCEYPDCQKSYTTKQSLDIHVSSYHENKRFRCEYPDCEKMFTGKRNLVRHVLSIHKNRRFFCEYQNCKKSYRSNDMLKLHVSSYHENRRLRCDYPDCQKSYTNRSGLFKHNSSEHNNIQHVCANCKEEFRQKSSLNRHIRVKNCQPSFSKTENDRMAEKIVLLETHLADIDSQIKTVAALISGFESFDCTECFLNK